MSESAPLSRLTEEQRAHVSIAQASLAHARTLNLAAASPADLVLAVESLRAALHDTLHVVSELAD